jgi:N-acetylglucosamine transport system permease protein
MRHGRYRFVTGFLAVPVVVYVVFMISPYVQDLYYSMTTWSGFSDAPVFVGFDNYVKLFGNEVFFQAFLHNVFFLVTVPLFTIVLALFLAFMLNAGGRGDRAGVQGIRGSSVYKIVLFFPYLLSVAIVVILFQQIFESDDNGLLNALLIKLHLMNGNNPGLWFSDENWVRWCLLIVMVWSGFGFYMVLFSAAMQSIPKDIYEAALLDGASRGHTFWRITLPLLWDTISVAWVYLGFIALDCFALVYALTPQQGGPNHASDVMSTVFYRTAFSAPPQFGYACAMGVALAVFSLLLAAVQLRVTRRETIEL